MNEIYIIANLNSSKSLDIYSDFSYILCISKLRYTDADNYLKTTSACGITAITSAFQADDVSSIPDRALLKSCKTKFCSFFYVFSLFNF